MRLTFKPGEFQAALSALAKIAPRYGAQQVVLKADPDALFVRLQGGIDPYVELRLDATFAEIAAFVAVAFPLPASAAAVKKYKGPVAVDLVPPTETAPGTVKIHTGSAVTTLPWGDANDAPIFPSTDAHDVRASTVLPIREACAAIRRVRHAAGREYTRPSTYGVVFSEGAVGATDGYRASLTPALTHLPAGKALIVPPPVLDLLLSREKSVAADGHVSLSAYTDRDKVPSPTWLTVTAYDSWGVYLRVALLDRWTEPPATAATLARLLTQHAVAWEVEMPASALHAACTEARRVSAGGVFTLTLHGMTLRAKNEDGGVVQVQVPTKAVRRQLDPAPVDLPPEEGEGEDTPAPATELVVGCNLDYVAEECAAVLAAKGKSDSVTLHFGTALDPVCVYAGAVGSPNDLGGIMPMRVA